jgi:HTH-type transcriptional regulator/antitoxin HigA
MRRVKSTSGRGLPADYHELVRLHPLQAIHDEVAYENAQEMIDALTSLPRLSRGQGEYLEALTVLFESYEDERHAIKEADVTPLAALRALMQEREMSASDLGRLLGDRALGPKILNGQRELSKEHIRKLAEFFGVRADLFL